MGQERPRRRPALVISVYVICEGRTETTVVKNVIAPELGMKGVFLSPIPLGGSGKSGDVTFPRLMRDIRNQLYSFRNCYCSTMFDYYGLDDDFPGKSEARKKSALSQKKVAVCDALSNELAKKLDEGPMQRFLPYVQMHEFEGLLFSDPDQLALVLGRQDLIQQFRAIRNSFDTPEHINDNPVTAPSKRLQSLVPRYRKVQMGERAARAMTLKKIRRECPLFDAWLNKLENLPPLPAP